MIKIFICVCISIGKILALFDEYFEIKEIKPFEIEKKKTKQNKKQKQKNKTIVEKQ